MRNSIPPFYDMNDAYLKMLRLFRGTIILPK
jgi:hypothetical protein